jgi:ribokinase
VSVVDTTAAGDAFNGALAVALTEGQPLDRAGRFANAAASITVTRAGAQTSMPERKDVERLLVERR